MKDKTAEAEGERGGTAGAGLLQNLNQLRTRFLASIALCYHRTHTQHTAHNTTHKQIENI